MYKLSPTLFVNESKIVAIRVNYVRDEDEDYCANLIVWVEGKEAPLIYQIPLIQAEYEEIPQPKLWGIFKRPNKQKLITYNRNTISTHPKLNKANYQIVLDFIAYFNKD